MLKVLAGGVVVRLPTSGTASPRPTTAEQRSLKSNKAIRRINIY
jgi:hypothetical protein